MFITNDSQFNSLYSVFQQKLPFCEEIKILVGYFYFSGFYELLKLLKNNGDLKIKILIGLEADVINGEIVELANNSNLSNANIKRRYFDSLVKVFNQSEFDNDSFYQNIFDYLKFLEEGRIEIRKTRQPNHAKLYLFKMNAQFSQLLDGFFITGSSNLTLSGLKEQNEFNVCIRDFGFKEANGYFDSLWEKAIVFNPEEIRKIIYIIKDRTILKKITPFEAYLYVLKIYLDSFRKKELSDNVKTKMEAAGYKPFQYQLDAIGQALAILEEHNGVIIADVVGLGKSVIASAIAYELRKRGLVVAPPGLIGSDDRSSGWKKYLEDFGLASMGWEVHSIGKLENLRELTRRIKDFEIVIIDEAHRFRNQDTQSYDLLREICRNKKVILLTATPFNNEPSDIFSLIKLFIIPKHSTITLNTNIEAQFSHYGYQYKQLFYIKKNYQSSCLKKQQRALQIFRTFFPNAEEVNIHQVNVKLKILSNEIKSILTPIMIRRNRLDLQKHPLYKKDIGKLSEVQDPIREYYFLTKEQSCFYDKVINKYFHEDGEFTGAIYMPYNYSKTETSDFEQLFQTNLYNLMRRLLVKRFESSFGAFYETIENFIQIHVKILEFIDKTKYYILDRDWINKISEYDEEEFLEEFNKKMLEIEKLEENRKSKIIYKINDLQESFLENIKKDLNLLSNIKQEMIHLQLHINDPKAEIVINHLKSQLLNDSERKIIIFSEYQATVKHISRYIEKQDEKLYQRCLVVEGDISKTMYETILSNFDASLSRNKQVNDYDVLICTDKLSEGLDLNRAGYIINYDIPWNPVRVIQRLGRINRIGKKVFDKLFIMNLFPTEIGEDVIQQQAIAENKMFMIHNSIGEDAKIFSSDETPTASELYTRLNTNPENLDEESVYTKVYIEFTKYKEKYPHVVSKIEQLPPRIKVAKIADKNELITLIKKHNLYFLYSDYSSNSHKVVSFENIWSKVKSDSDTLSVPLSKSFWTTYQQAITFMPYFANRSSSDNSIFQKAFNKIHSLLTQFDNDELKEFLEILLTDLQEYGTLSDYRLRQIINIKTRKDIEQLKNYLGEEYIQSLMKQFNDNKYVIIAIENQQPELFNQTNSN